MANQVAHPMVKLQQKVSSLVESKIMKSEDPIWKIAFLYGDSWGHWKQELLDFGFRMEDPVKELLMVEQWDED